MNLINDKRGMVRIIESLFASLLILSTLALVPSQLGMEQTHYTTLYSEGTQVLVSLDSNGMGGCGLAGARSHFSCFRDGLF